MSNINKNVDNVKTEIDIVNLRIEDVYPNPDNPRKNLGDLTEMAESIKKNGIMQNLTVVPGHKQDGKEWSPEGYTLIIGHRRRAAAELAGVKELPCRIVTDMDEKTQFSTMLEENMQRNDLTIIEQANGFQMMLDLGETVDSIVEKTGFSKSTVHHRLNIAKLDQKVLKKKQEDDYFQLNIKDLQALEQIKSIKTRNRVLSEASDSRQLIWKAQQEAKEEKKEEVFKELIEKLEALGIKKAPKGAENEQWSDKWEKIRDYDYEKEVPKKITFKEKIEELVYCRYYNFVRVMRLAKKKVKKKTAEELKMEERSKRKKEIDTIFKQLNKRRTEFIISIINGDLPKIKETEELKDEIWNILVEMKGYLTTEKYTTFFTGKYYYNCTQEEQDEVKRKTEEISIVNSMLIHMSEAMNNAGNIYSYMLEYQEKTGEKLLRAYAVLEKYGWTFENENEVKLLNGTHEYYEKEDK